MISGKVGGTVIAQEELASLFSDSRKDQQQLNQQFQQLNLNPNQRQNNFQDPRFASNSQQNRDPFQFIHFRYTNPLKPQVNQDVSVNSDMWQLYNSIQIPVINSLEKILQNCETMRDNYNSLLTMSQELSNESDKSKSKSSEKSITNEKLKSNEKIDKSPTTTGPWGRASGGNSNTNKQESSPHNMFEGYGGSMQNNGYSSQNSGYQAQNSGYPSQNQGYASSMKISSTAREQDIHNFVTKFQCARSTAIGYLEAFGSYDQACKEYQANT